MRFIDWLAVRGRCGGVRWDERVRVQRRLFLGWGHCRYWVKGLVGLLICIVYILYISYCIYRN